MINPPSGAERRWIMSEMIVKPIRRIGAELFDTKGHLLVRGWRENVMDEICRYANSHDALLEACKAWQKYDSEMADKHPCPDYTLRTAYRNEARKLTDIAVKLAEKEG
jgi:hypothetical protein